MNQNEKGKIVPGVATQWESNDNHIPTFTLRDNAKWADGTQWRKILLQLARLVDPKTLSPFAWFAALAGIDTTGDYHGKATPDQLGVTPVDAQLRKFSL
ncbi:ABC transporter substrate-binding protein [Shigella flexneri]